MDKKTDYRVLAVSLRTSREQGSAGVKPVTADEMYLSALYALIAWLERVDPLFDRIEFQRVALGNGG